MIAKVAVTPSAWVTSIRSEVYGSRGYSALQLVTCGGTFDRQARSYRSNVVVYSSLVTWWTSVIGTNRCRFRTRGDDPVGAVLDKAG